MSGGRWLPEEDTLIREHYPAGSVVCQSFLPGRTIHAIRRRASQMGIACVTFNKPPPKLRRKPSPEIDAQITAFYQAPRFGGLKKLRSQTGKSVGYLKKRAQALGLSVARIKAPEWTDEERDRLAELVGLSPVMIRRKLVADGYPPRTITAIAVAQKRLEHGINQTMARQDAGWYTARQIAALVGKDAKAIVRWIQQGWLQGQRAGTLRRDDFWMIHEQDLKTMLMTYAENLELQRWDRRFLVQVLSDPAPKKRLSLFINPV